MTGCAGPPAFGPPAAPGDPHAPVPYPAEVSVRPAAPAGTQTAAPGAWLLPPGRTPASDAAPAGVKEPIVSTNSHPELLNSLRSASRHLKPLPRLWSSAAGSMETWPPTPLHPPSPPAPGQVVKSSIKVPRLGKICGSGDPVDCGHTPAPSAAASQWLLAQPAVQNPGRLENCSVLGTYAGGVTQNEGGFSVGPVPP